MTDKWADYLISAVRYNDEETHIDQVRAHVDEGDNAGSATTTARSTVVERLEPGYTFVTIYKGSNDRWQKGAQVRVVVIDDEKFIRTDADATKADNLGNLPTF
jgi:hypothetical protein